MYQQDISRNLYRRKQGDSLEEEKNGRNLTVGAGGGSACDQKKRATSEDKHGGVLLASLASCNQKEGLLVPSRFRREFHSMWLKTDGSSVSSGDSQATYDVLSTVASGR